MCFLTPAKCRRTKTVCDKAECRHRWQERERALMLEAGRKYADLVDSYRTKDDAVPDGATVH